ncbi:hypothetical protein Tco_0888157 [Tanacetum coccineum]
MFDELLTPPPSVDYPASEVVAPIHEVVTPVPAVSTGSPSSTNVDQDAPSPSHSQTTPETQSPIIPNDVEEDNHDIEIEHMGNDPYFEPKTYKDALTQSCWIEAMPEELNEFERLELDELWSDILKNKARLSGSWYTIKKMEYELDETFASVCITPMVENPKLMRIKKGKALDPSHYRAFQNAIKLVLSMHVIAHSGIEQYLVDRLVSRHQKGRKVLRYPVRKLNILPYRDVVLKFFGRDHSLPTMTLDLIKFQCTEHVKNGVIELYLSYGNQTGDIFHKSS